MPDLMKTWDEAQARLKSQIGETAFQTWIVPLKASEQTGGCLSLRAPDGFFRDWVDQHYKAAIQDLLRDVSSEPHITISIDAAEQAPSIPQTAILKPPIEKLPAENSTLTALNPRYTFEHFVIGPSNRHAHAYSMAVADSPAKAYNPLFIYGGVGLGKTHLIQAICHHLARRFPEMKIHYVSSERFTNELIDAIQHHSTAAFRQKYRHVDVLVIDDIHFIAGKESTQEEFFHTFNALYDAHKQIVFCSDRPPKEINNLQDRLVSRFGWGLTTDVQPPDFETRVAILQKKIEREPVAVPQDVMVFIAQLIKTNIRELEGALIRTIAYSLLEEEPITLDLAKEVLKDLMKEPERLVTVDFIQRCVAEEFGIGLAELKTKRRNKTIVLPRQIAMYLSRVLTDLSLPEIGTHFGGKDHTTVLHSFNKIKEDVVKNDQLKIRIDRITNIIKQ